MNSSFLKSFQNLSKVKVKVKAIYMKRECIPVGCIPPAAVAARGSASVHTGIHIPLGCRPGDPCVWAWRPPRPEPSTSPLGVGLETPQVWAWKPARHAGIPPPKTCCKACWNTTCNACWNTPPPHGQNSWHTLLKILSCPKLRLRAVINQIKTFIWTPEVLQQVSRLAYGKAVVHNNLFNIADHNVIHNVIYNCFMSFITA